MPFQMSLKNDLTELQALSHADLIEPVTLEMVEETALMAPETSDLIPFQMSEASCLMPFQTPLQSPLIAAMTMLMTSWMTVMAVLMAVLMSGQTASMTALIAGQTAFHTAWMTPSARVMASWMAFITVVTTCWIRGMLALIKARSCVMMGMTNDAIWVYTPRTAVMMAAMMGATPPRTPASC